MFTSFYYKDHMTSKEFLEQWSDRYSTKQYNIGDVILLDDTNDLLVMVDSNQWMKLETDPRSILAPAKELKRKLITKCKSCGASLPITEQTQSAGFCTCDYCGSLVSVFEYC